MFETSKAVNRRLHDVRFATRYFVGNGIDIGSGNDSLDKYRELFPLIKEVHNWDKVHGDAQYLSDVPDKYFDFVHSSHCLEHMEDPYEAIENWFRVLKENGHLICVVPDEDLYEQGVFPSRFNSDHKHTFTISKLKSWSNCWVNVVDLVHGLGHYARPLKIELLDATYRYELPSGTDQTRSYIGEAAIEFIIQKIG